MGLTRKQLVMIAVLLSGTFLAVLNLTLLSPALPSIMVDMGVDATTVQWLTSIYSLVEAVVIPLSAYLMSRFSTRQLFIGGFILFSIGSFLCASSPQFWVMLVGRVCQAACTGFVMPMVTALILLIFPREKRGSAMGLVTLIIGFAPAIGPSVSGLLVDSIGWRWLFYGITALSVLIVFFAFVTLKNFEGFARGTFDPLSVALSTLGLLGVLYGLSTFTETTNMTLTLSLIAAGIVLIVLFIIRQQHLEEPMLKVDIFKTRNYRIAVIIVVIIQLAIIGGGVVVPIFIQNVLGFSATVTGLVILPGAILGAIVSMFAGRLFDRVGVRPVAIIGGIIMSVGAIGLYFFNIGTELWFLIASNIIMTVGLQATLTPINTWGINSLDNKVIQHGTALFNTMNQIGGSFGTALLVSLSALGAIFYTGSPEIVQTAEGMHIAMSAQASFIILDFIIVLIFARSRNKNKNKNVSD